MTDPPPDANDPASLPALFLARQTQDGSGLGACLGHLGVLFAKDDLAAIRRLHDATTADNPMRVASYYVLAGIAAHAGDIDGCKEGLRAALVMAQAHLGVLATTGHACLFLGNLVKQYALIDPGLDLAAALATTLDGEGEPFAPDAPPWFVMASCNGVYFDRFAEAFAAGLYRAVPSAACHLQIINPTPASGVLADRLLGRHHDLRIGRETGPDEATYFACRRFQVAGPLMRRYRRAAVVSDIDVALGSGIADFTGLEAVAAGLFKKPSVDPMLIMHLSLSYFAFRPKTLVFLDGLDRYLTAHMAQGYVWTLDQCAVLTVGLLAQQGRIPGLDGAGLFAIADLAPALGRPLEAFQTNQAASLPEKLALRRFSPGD